MPKVLTETDIETFRERLCDVAEELFASRGPESVTLRQLAEAMGVSSMTPYRYFKDKDAILAAVRTRAFNSFSEAMEAARDRLIVEGKPADAGEAYLAWALANRNAYRLMFDVNQPTYETYPDLLAAMERARATMGAGLKMLAGKGRFPHDVQLAAYAFWAAMHGPVMLELAGLLVPPLDARAVARPALEGLLKLWSVPAAPRGEG